MDSINSIDIKEREVKRIIYDNSSDELPMLQLTISDEVEGFVRSTHLVVKASKYKECEKGMTFLMSKHRELSSKKRKVSKYKDRSWG